MWLVMRGPAVVNRWSTFRCVSIICLVIYQHPLAYLLGLEGIALLRAFAGDYDREFTEARLADIRDLLDSVQQLGDGAAADAITTMDGYRAWAEFYDLPGNQLIDLEQPIVREILDGLAPGIALDAACGTGRHTEYLASLGHSVIGVDSSPDMLARARTKVPDGEFHCSDLHLLPVQAAHVDVLVCALALMHVPDLDAAFAEFVRILRPGGHAGHLGLARPDGQYRPPSRQIGSGRASRLHSVACSPHE